MLCIILHWFQWKLQAFFSSARYSYFSIFCSDAVLIPGKKEKTLTTWEKIKKSMTPGAIMGIIIVIILLIGCIYLR